LQTSEEHTLGFRFLDGWSPTGAAPDENCVLEVAGAWSINPMSLDEEYKEPVMGLIGDLGGESASKQQPGGTP
jgi:hypothetical protein